MSRWRQQASFSELVKIHRAILDAKEAVETERAEDIRAARENARLTLGSHGLFMASVAVRASAMSSWTDYKLINERIRAGGFHRVRLTGGRGIDG